VQKQEQRELTVRHDVERLAEIVSELKRTGASTAKLSMLKQLPWNLLPSLRLPPQRACFRARAGL
jgi:lambda repressor-like predicted transcriptional regulator